MRKRNSNACIESNFETGKRILRVGKININITREFLGNYYLEDKLYAIILNELTEISGAKLEF